MLLFASFALFFATSAVAQTITGKVIDPQGKPVANLEVLMHGVNNESGKGAEVGKDTTNADGSFEISVKSPDPSLVYFVAVVWKGQLFVGDMLQAPFPANKEYVVQVGVDPVDLTPQSETTEIPPEEQKKDKTAGVIVIVAALVLITAVGYIIWQRRPDPRRALLVKLARIEIDLEKDPSDAALQQQRSDLRNRLRSAKSG